MDATGIRRTCLDRIRLWCLCKIFAKFSFLPSLRRVPPQTLYKYSPPRGIDILRTLRLKITAPNQFNDPFELAPRMEERLTPEKALDALGEPRVLTMTYQQMVTSGQFVGSFEDFSRA